MEVLDQLSVALGFATLAGINLYLTAFVTGLAIQFHWVILAERYHELTVLGEPAVLFVTGALLLTEILADKVPWVDSVWDAFHSLIRPVGGGLLAVSAIGTTRPEYDVIVALLGASAASVSHGFKSGTRLAVNHSPEPFSNCVLSVTEDAAVLGGLSLMAIDPKILAGICVVFLAIAIYSFPRILRRLRGFYWLLFRNVLGDGPVGGMGHSLSEPELEAVSREVGEPRVLACMPVLTSRVRQLAGMCPWLVGRLVVIDGPNQPRLLLVAKRWRGYCCAEFPRGTLRVSRQVGLLGEKVCVDDPSGKFQVTFRLPRGMDALVQAVINTFERPASPTLAGGVGASAGA
jgi:hypothetical protein